MDSTRSNDPLGQLEVVGNIEIDFIAGHQLLITVIVRGWVTYLKCGKKLEIELSAPFDSNTETSLDLEVVQSL